MLDPDSVEYAIENTHVIVEPQNRIETFGSTVFRFFHVAELMDSVNQIRVRDGRLHAERPSIITPAHFHRMLDEDFGEKAAAFIEFMRDHAADLAVMRYGFKFRKTDVRERVVNRTLEQVIAGLREDVDRAEDPLVTVIQGVDEGWEVSLLKFASDMIQKSAPGNMNEWKRRGLL